MAAVKPLRGNRRNRPHSNRGRRVARLRERLQTETDPKVRSAIEAQLRSFDRSFSR